MAAHIIAWLKTWHGKQFPLVTRVQSFWTNNNPGADIDLVVSHRGKDERVKVKVKALSEVAFEITITRFRRSKVVWKRVGYRDSFEGEGMVYKTLPRSSHPDWKPL